MGGRRYNGGGAAEGAQESVGMDSGAVGGRVELLGVKLVIRSAELANAGGGVGDEAGVAGAEVCQAVHGEGDVLGGHAGETAPRGGSEGAHARVGARDEAAVAAAGLSPQAFEVVESRDGVCGGQLPCFVGGNNGLENVEKVRKVSVRGQIFGQHGPLAPHPRRGRLRCGRPRKRWRDPIGSIFRGDIHARHKLPRHCCRRPDGLKSNGLLPWWWLLPSWHR